MTATAPCITVSTTSPANTPAVSSTNQLAQLSRNASVISTSSSSSASSLVNTPQTRPRPLRQFSYQPPSRPRSPTDQSSRTRSPSRPPVSPSTPRGSRAPPPVWVPRELGRADDSDDSDSVLPALAPPSSRRGSESRMRVQSRKGSVSTVRRGEQPESHSRGPSLSEFAPPASPKNAAGVLAGSPKLGSRALVGPGKRSRVPSTASSAAALAGQLEVVGGPSQVQTSSNLNPNVGHGVSRTAAPSPTPPAVRKRRTQSTSTTKARSRSTSAAPRQRQPVSAADFEFGPELGSGSYSTVVKAWFRGNTGNSGGASVMGGIAGVTGAANGDPNLKVYAVKVSDKQYLINKGKVKYANVEKSALALLGAGNQHRGHPGIVKLHWTFHDPTSLYAPEGQGASTTNPGSVGPASSATGAGDSVVDQPRASSFVGTAEYVSPELLINNVTSRGSDVWAIGCILFQMLAGRPPFKGGSEYLTLEQVKRLEYEVPEHFDSVAEELVKSILVLDPAARPTTAAIRTHPFLAEIVWEDLWTCTAPPMESGPCKGPPPPEPPMQFDSDDDDETWNQFADGDDEDEEGGPRDVGSYMTRMGYFGPTSLSQQSTSSEPTPRATHPSYNFQDYKFGEVSTVPVPTTEDSSLLLQAGSGPHSRSSVPPSLPPILSPGLPNLDNEIAVEDEDYRRVLVLTDTSRLLCIKEERDRVVVKFTLLFSGRSTPQPPPNPRGRSIARWKQHPSTFSASTQSVAPGAEANGEQEITTDEMIQSVDMKGEKSFTVQTLSKVYTFVADNSEEAQRWVHQLKDAQQAKRRWSSRLSTRPTVVP
ncbi:pkb-activating kinase-like protein [Ceratobasidium sp. 423]|nr:pkb-activating kinase-like protein [Ceratobasidium sp. 423]